MQSPEDGDAEVNFEPHLNSSWVLQPRVLIAAGFSTIADVLKPQLGPVLLDGSSEGQIKRISQIGTEKWMKYQISVEAWLNLPTGCRKPKVAVGGVFE